MKPQIALTPDQMRELQSLGLDCSDASMVWKIKGESKPRLMVAINFFEEVKQNMSKLGYVPAYTLEDILLKLPKYLYGEDGWELMVTKSEVSYRDNVTDCIHSCWGYTLMRNAFEMLKWALKNHPDKIKRL